MFENVTRLFNKHVRDVKKITPIVREVNEWYGRYQDLSDEDLRGKTEEFRARIAARTESLKAGLEDLRERFRTSSQEEREYAEEEMTRAEEDLKKGELAVLDEILPEAYAAVKEVCRRFFERHRSWQVLGQRIVWDMIPYDVQLVGAIALHQGKVTEMATGEGKTLAATMPLYLNALTGKGVHLITPNDYLARRDASWMGPVYKFLGLSVGVIQDKRIDSGPDSFLVEEEGDDYVLRPVFRGEAYRADITYGNNDEFGFDYLRDNMATEPEELVQRGHYYGIVDEADSVLIDEARTPHIMSGPVPESTHRYKELKPIIQRLVQRQEQFVHRLVEDAKRLLQDDEADEYEAGLMLLRAQRGAPKNRRLAELLQEEGIKRLIAEAEGNAIRNQAMHEVDEELYYIVDERGNVIDFTDKGRESLPRKEQEMFTLPDLEEELAEVEADETLSEEERAKRVEEVQQDYTVKSETSHNVSQLLKAYSLFERDVEYLVTDDGRIVIVDEFTGRPQPGRRFSDGLHAALEAKEGVRIQKETQTVATITLQNYFRLYDKLAGMTGTAETEASELYDIYKMDVVVIPTNEPVRRMDYDDLIYRTREEKYAAILDEIEELHGKGLPVLVGTVSVEVSEFLGRRLKAKGIPHHVLNAKYHQQEAEIVALAGGPGTVTIATNMAGRGTDIKLHPSVVKAPEGHRCALILNPEDDRPSCPYLQQYGCMEDVPCGLHIIGTARHESRRIDRQLRGRCGRQGDPGASRFYLSLEDDLMRLFGSERIAAVMDRLGLEEGEVIQHPLVTKSIERAQRRVEARNFAYRKHVLEYDDVMNLQREVVYDRRREALLYEDVQPQIEEMIRDTVDKLVDAHTDERSHPEEWDLIGLSRELPGILRISLSLDDEDDGEWTVPRLKERIRELADEAYAQRERLVGPEIFHQIEKRVLLGVIDDKWREHLYEMDRLREGIGLRGYGQRDPLVEYKKESYEMFVEMLDNVARDTLRFLFTAPIHERVELAPRRRPERVQAVHQDATGMGFADAPDAEEAEEFEETPAARPERGRRRPRGRARRPRGEGGGPAPVRAGPKVGRNDPCPCGSGKKYKKCCGAPGR